MSVIRSATVCTLAATLVLLTACDKESVPPPPVSRDLPAVSGAPDPSVPDAKAALAADAASAAQAENSSAPSTMTEEQKSKAMPLPGQANDHSSPAKADKPADQQK